MGSLRYSIAQRTLTGYSSDLKLEGLTLNGFAVKAYFEETLKGFELEGSSNLKV
jgi:hypothetical protein